MKPMDNNTMTAVAEVRKTKCEFLTIPQVAEILKVNRNTVYALIHANLLRAVRLGSTKVSTMAVEEFIARYDAGEIKWESPKTRTAKEAPAKSKTKSKANSKRAK